MACSMKKISAWRCCTLHWLRSTRRDTVEIGWTSGQISFYQNIRQTSPMLRVSLMRAPKSKLVLKGSCANKSIVTAIELMEHLLAWTWLSGFILLICFTFKIELCASKSLKWGRFLKSLSLTPCRFFLFGHFAHFLLLGQRGRGWRVGGAWKADRLRAESLHFIVHFCNALFHHEVFKRLCPLSFWN